jgi:hypothetical protein
MSREQRSLGTDYYYGDGITGGPSLSREIIIASIKARFAG